MHYRVKGLKMIERFREIKDIYASKEVSMDELQVIHESGVVTMDNHGVSRSKKDCLMCRIRYKEPELLSESFKVYVRISS